jgi:hypothetical protein
MKNTKGKQENFSCKAGACYFGFLIGFISG